MVRFQCVSSLENGLDISGGKVTVRNGARKGDAKLIFNVMSLNIKKGDLLEFSIEGENEREDAVSLEKYVRENL